MSWAPKEITFVLDQDPLLTSTRPVRVMTDVGEALIKAPNNPEGPQVLAREWVAAGLATTLGLEVPGFAMIDLVGDEFKLDDGRAIGKGAAFASRWIPEFYEWDGESKSLQGVGNLEMLGLIPVFDTWIRNTDRHRGSSHPDGSHWNYGNIGFRQSKVGGCVQRQLVAIDHSHVFNRPDLDRHLADIAVVKDDAVYGTFPQFAPHILWGSLASAVGRLCEVTDCQIRATMEGLPDEWGVDHSVVRKLEEMLQRRRDFLCESNVASSIWSKLKPGMLPMDELE